MASKRAEDGSLPQFQALLEDDSSVEWLTIFGCGAHSSGIPMATLRWIAGNVDGPAVVKGFDTAEVVEGRISKLWVLIEPTGS